MFTQLSDRMHLVRYAIFAGVAILINLAIQNAVLLLMPNVWFRIYTAILASNGAGLVFKFVADKLWVFDDKDLSARGNSRKFILYAMFGVLTTALFWGVELGFHYTFNTTFMTNVGAVIGLTAGYIIKYNLDKHFTFRRKTLDSAESGAPRSE